MTSKIIFNNDIIKFMSIFHNVTNTNLKDCIDFDNKIVFIVDENNAGKAIGKKGINVKKLEQKFKKKIMIVEYSKDIKQFIVNVIYPNKVQEVTEVDGVYTIVSKDKFTRGMIIGRNAVNLREYENIVKRYYPIKEIKVL
ncbi:MAG: NusA-like transcription termination signal-binding factor [Candidatus Woesearchaeota archaeon]